MEFDEDASGDIGMHAIHVVGWLPARDQMGGLQIFRSSRA
jgi:hypothetical protein